MNVQLLFIFILLSTTNEGLLLQNAKTSTTTSQPIIDKTLTSSMPMDCQDYQWHGYSTSGLYTIYPQKGGKLVVYCDQHTDGGGWTVLQRRMDGTVDFFRNWSEYMYGFGNKSKEHWLGNHYIFEISNQGYYELRVDMEDFEGEKRFAIYKSFSIGDETTGFKARIQHYTGTAGDSMSIHNGALFHTKDRDTNSCAARFKGGWWYTNCHNANLNGLYLRGAHSSFADGIEWNAWHGQNYALKFTEMKIRRL